MKKLLFFICMIPTVIGSAQNSNKELNELHQQMQKGKLDSSLKNLDSLILRQTKSMDSAAIARDMELNNRNLDSFLADQKERRQKEKRNALLRLGFGILILAFGIFAMLRRRKPRQNKN